MLGRRLAVEFPSELSNIPGDIIFVGYISHINMAHKVLRGAGLIYGLQHQEQLARKIRGTNKKTEVPSESFTQFDQAGLVGRLYALTGELYLAREQKDKSKENNVRQRLLNLSSGSRFTPQIAGLVEAFSRGGENTERIIELQVTLAGFIHAEKYNEAATAKRELDQLLNN